MTIKKALVSIISSALIFSALGGAIGFLLGKLLPNYYRSVFINGESPHFDPIQVGLGLGLTQGFMGE